MKSWITGGRIGTGEAYAQNSTNFFRIGSSIESSSSVTRLRSQVPEAMAIRKWGVRCGANTLTGNCTVTVRVNNTTDSALAVTFANTDADVEKRDISDTVALALNDDIIGKVVCAAGGTSILLLSHSLEIEPTNEANTLSHLSTQSQGSTAYTTVGSSYGPPLGARNTTDTEDNAEWTCIAAFVATYFSASSGTTSYNQNVTIRTRKNGAAGGQSVVFTASDDQVTKYDTSGSDTLADGDTFNYEVERAVGGSGTFNLENVNVWLRNTANQFIIGAADIVSGNACSAALTRYAGLSGELTKSATEAVAQQVAPFDMVFKLIQVLSRTENMTGDTTVTLRVAGAGTALTVTYPGSGGGALGIKETAGSVAAVGDTSAISTEIVTGAGTTRDINYIVYLVEVEPEITDRDIQVPGGGVTTDTGAGDLNIPGGGVVLPQSPVEIVILEAEVLETITVVDNTSVAFPATLTKEISETVTAVDFSKAVLVPDEVFEVEEVVVEDSARVGLVLGIIQAETIAVQDSTTSQGFAGLEVAESVTVVDAATLALDPISAVLVETVAVNEFRVADLGIVPVIENVVVTDFANLRVTPATMVLVETISVTDRTQFNSIFVDQGEVISVTDAVSMAIGRRFVPRPWWW